MKTKLSSFTTTDGKQVDVEIEPKPFAGNTVLIGAGIMAIGFVTAVVGAWANGGNDMVKCIDDAYKKSQQ